MSICNYLIETINPEDWQLKITVNKTAEILGENSHIPIAAFDLGLDFTSPYLLAEADCSSKKSTWNWGGKICPLYYIDTQKVCGQAISLTLAQTKLLNMGSVVSVPYKLQFEPPKWFRNLTLRVWEYVGTTSNEVTNKLTDIETKIDQLL